MLLLLPPTPPQGQLIAYEKQLRDGAPSSIEDVKAFEAIIAEVGAFHAEVGALYACPNTPSLSAISLWCVVEVP